MAAAGVDLVLGRHATVLDTRARQVGLDGSELVDYDRLVLATGAHPVIPGIDGLRATDGELAAGVHALRTIDDCREIVAATTNAGRAIVLGGGLLGLEAARGLWRRGLDVTVLQAQRYVMNTQLDAAAATVVGRLLRRGGVRLRTDVRVVAASTRDGRFTGLTVSRAGDAGATDAGATDAGATDAGAAEHLPAELLVLACGVRPATELAAEAGLPVGRGVLVDDAMRTADPLVFAIGDCAEHRGEVAGLVAPAWEQARVVADQLTGTDPTSRYTGQRPVIRLKAADLDVTAVGETQADPWDEDDQLDVVQLLDPARGRYVKAVIRSGTVVGAIAVGEPRAGAELALLVERGSPAPADRSVLLLPGVRAAAQSADDPTLIPDRATICRCNGVTKGAIVTAWRGGARTGDALAGRTRATTGCGTCRDTVDGLLRWLAAADPDPLPAEPAAEFVQPAHGVSTPHPAVHADNPAAPPQRSNAHQLDAVQKGASR